MRPGGVTFIVSIIAVFVMLVNEGAVFAIATAIAWVAMGVDFVHIDTDGNWNPGKKPFWQLTEKDYENPEA